MLVLGLFLAVSHGAPVFEPIDLAAHYNIRASQSGWPFPRGAQTWNGVPFVIEGRVEVTGLDDAQSGEFLPPHSAGIAIQRKALRLHIVHAARHGRKAGVPLANVVLRYRNGDTRVCRLAFGVHAGNVQPAGDEPTRLVADPNSALVWSSPGRGRAEAGTRLFVTAIDNPQPEDEIAAIDFVSLFSRATPILFAVTVQTGGELAPLQPLPERKLIERATELADSAYRRELRIQVRSDDGTALTNARAVATLKDDRKTFYFGQYAAGLTGTIAIAYPPQEAVSLNVRVSSPGFVAATRTFSMNDPAPWPESIELRLERGRPIGGVVVNTAGQPVAGASVIPFEIVPTGRDEYARTDFDLARTDASGRWTAAIAHSLSNLSFEVRHDEHRAKQFSGLSTSDLLAGRARLAVDPETRVAGRIVNSRRSPIAGARVLLDRPGAPPIERETGSSGEFSFIVRDAEGEPATLIALATNLAPARRAVRLEETLPPLGDIVLEPGRALDMRIVDNANRPVTNLIATLIDWEGTQALEWSARTDADGRFRWEHAPVGRVRFQYEKPGSLRQTHTLTLPVSREITFNYSAPSRIVGRVLDAESEQPIESFRVRIGYSYNEGRSSGTTTMTGTRGRFSSYIGSSRYEQVTVLLEARGYEPLSTNLPPFDGVFSNVFHLSRARLLPGLVRTRDGKPVAKAEVVLIDRNSSAYMDEPGRLRRSSTFDGALSDDAGRFELTPKLEADLVVAAHPELGFGELPFREITNGAPLVLQPWGRVEGVMRIGTKLEPYHYAALHAGPLRRSDAGRSTPAVYTYFKVKPEPDGRFVFDGVPPGERIVYLRHLFQERDPGSMKVGHGVPVTVKPGETNQVVVGGGGRTVVGKIEVAGDRPARIDWRRDHQHLRWQPEAQLPRRLTFPANATAEERARLMTEQSRRMAEQMRENQLSRVYTVVVEEDGRFHAHNVLPGRYMLQLSAVEPTSTTSYRYLGTQTKTIVVPEGTGPHDLGAISYMMRR